MPTPMGRFAALDFETADYGRDSACAVALVVGEGTRIVQTASFLIRPPRQQVLFTHVHGLTWNHVKDQPRFADVWPAAARLLDGVEFIAAHSAAFDRGVLLACCQTALLAAPQLPFYCTVKIARKAWDVRPTRLPDVCRHLGLSLKHHDAESDATACANIVIAARKDGHPLTGKLNETRGGMRRGGSRENRP